MSRRLTLERILRDDDDDSGQTIRQWVIQREGDFITLQAREGWDFISLRTADIKQLYDDLCSVADIPS